MTILCPKCRSLGLTTDCTDTLNHAGTAMITDESPYELHVTLTLAIPVTSTRPLDPHEMAFYMRERWMNDPTRFLNAAAEVMTDDFELSVRPAFIRD